MYFDTAFLIEWRSKWDRSRISRIGFGPPNWTRQIMEEKEFPWPEKGDQLFTSGEDWWLSSYIESWNKDFHAYAEGYKQAADIITAEVTGTEEKFLKSTRDYVVYPVVFLYRHYVELRLKEIILIGRKLYDMSQGLPKHHKIEELWKHARGILSHTSSK